MQTKEWQEKDLNDIDDYSDYQQVKNKQQAKSKWREIEALKEKKRMQREIAYYDSYAMH
jgi:hypothetical protein